MKRPVTRSILPVALVLGVVALAALPAVAPAAVEEEPPASIVGPTTREAVEAAEPSWVAATVEAEIDVDDATALAAVEPGADVTIFLGTWCDDSRREVPRLWRALDQVGGLVSFEIEYVAVDRDKAEPAARVDAAGLQFVPTFVVRRGGEEVGRVVEISPNGIETDLLALLSGEASGVLSGREEL